MNFFRHIVVGLTVLVAAGGAARADVKIVKKVTTVVTEGDVKRSGTRISKTQTVTVYYKGQRSHTETGVQIGLYNGAKGQTVFLDTMYRSYRLTAAVSPQAVNAIKTRMVPQVTGTAKPTGRTRIIGGKLAKEYVYDFSFSIRWKPGIKDASGRLLTTLTPGPVYTAHLTGYEWHTEGLAGVTDSKMSPIAALLTIPGFEKLGGFLSQMKGLELDNEQVLTVRTAATTQAGRGPTVTTVTSKVISVKEGPLPDSLFTIPAGYHEYKPAPRRPQTGTAGRK